MVQFLGFDWVQGYNDSWVKLFILSLLTCVKIYWRIQIFLLHKIAIILFQYHVKIETKSSVRFFGDIVVELWIVQTIVSISAR